MKEADKKRIPQAAICESDGCGHQFNNNLSEVDSDIANLKGETHV